MVPEIKSHSVNDGQALEVFRPEDPGNFSLILRLIIGPRGQPGEESFDITICTPASLVEECARHGFVLGRHLLVVSAYDPPHIMSVLRKLVADCSGLSWAEVGSKLARIAYWEFEGYQDAR
jgi:Immunity protein 8